MKKLSFLWRSLSLLALLVAGRLTAPAQRAKINSPLLVAWQGPGTAHTLPHALPASGLILAE